VDSDGDAVLLEEQDRSLWDRAAIAEGVALLDQALTMRRAGPYQIQAAIAALPDEALTSAQTDWPQIAALYTTLARLTPSPVIELNRAVALAMIAGPERGLELLNRPTLATALAEYQHFHAARADLLRRVGGVERQRVLAEQVEHVLADPRRLLRRAVCLDKHREPTLGHLAREACGPIPHRFRIDVLQRGHGQTGADHPLDCPDTAGNTVEESDDRPRGLRRQV